MNANANITTLQYVPNDRTFTALRSAFLAFMAFVSSTLTMALATLRSTFMPTVPAVALLAKASRATKATAKVEHRCRVCGKIIPASGKPGRPAVYCSAACKKTAKK